ncbi:hypothetical protein [Saccharothrix variisporea]|uniref:Uncharacterized protein n=1 Tax=Saccharothrix variisporea TaxID=543527 RepID=A0A495X6B7_9PSEU|nr:hypothetical protein [Saccharothrix variisporea]RKT69931.1 hypothetical protein DFJ66_3170 [Saccharothrix variisporea]
MSSIKVDLAVRGRPPMSIVLPAQEVISTTLVVSNTDPSLPTLLSVERIVAKVGNLGIAVADERVLTALAAMVNEHYLAVRPNLWHDTEIRVEGEVPPKGADAESFRAVGALRAPVLHSAETIMRSGHPVGSPQRRAEETRLVDTVNATIVQQRSIWDRWPGQVAKYVAGTLLSPIITALIGVPLLDLANYALAGVNRIV